MLKYIFEYCDGSVSYHEVTDKIDFMYLLGEIGKFAKMYFFDGLSMRWIEEMINS